MRALVLAGGTGSRMRPLSHTLPKQLVPVAGRPVLEHAILGIRELGITDVGVVTGNGAALVRRSLGDGGRLGVRLTYVHQGRPRGLADCVRAARDFLADEDFVLYLGDNLLPSGVRGLAEEFRARGSDAHLAVQRVADPGAFGVVQMGADGKVERLVEKPTEPVSDLAVIGVYFFSPAVHDAVRAIVPSRRGELEITDAVQWLLERGYGVSAGEYGGFWSDVGRPEDVLTGNRHVLGLLAPAAPEGSVDAASRVEGAVRVGRGARVVRSTVSGPAVIGPGTVVEDSAVGPGTSIGSHCSLYGADVADSVVMDGTRISGPAPLRGSLVGRESVILSPRTALPADRRLVVGDHTQIDMGC
ncbi:glucose-1-phosphate thymidylyltransferase [Nocardiopsis sp. TSRI0078]|uniref:glucose-1-phosphate thymidylyltransferase n=1 Tax=unclassified Nocardiopsis TaxID=2649073 RepID=UPI000940645D|nr:glucose-1-phosphate thymidylyltransferase [Nocardiopsis sp. TSRI0078]OKI23469.1 glucose-1-phosphate thymidylyltransferase [Nocardiopsis sp. TSRI0078]